MGKPARRPLVIDWDGEDNILLKVIFKKVITLAESDSWKIFFEDDSVSRLKKELNRYTQVI